VDELCPDCGANLLIRTGRFGKFFSCSRFPACKFTKPYVEQTNFVCPKDAEKGGKIIIKKTRKGRKFYGCSNYPNCDFAAWKLEGIKTYKPTPPTAGAKTESSDEKTTGKVVEGDTATNNTSAS
jgi:DNA topoisomerase-1